MVVTMKTVISNKIYIQDPTDEIIEYCKKELILDNPQYYKLQKMNKWTGNTPKNIYLFEKNGNTLILPFGCAMSIFNSLGIDMKFEFAPIKEANYVGDIDLYDYQQKAVNNAVLSRNGVIIGQCGCGKTQIGIALIQKLGLKALWITHTKELLTQSKERYTQYFGTEGTGVITEGKINIGSKITFATVQTLSNIDLQEHKDDWNVIIVDECHRLCGTPTQLTMFYKVLSSLKARHKYGLTATAHRSDGLIKTMFAVLGPVVHEIPKEAVANKTIRPFIKPVYIEHELSRECFDTDGTVIFNKALNDIAFNDSYLDRIVADLRSNSENYCLILSDRLEQLRTIKNKLGSHKAVMIDGTMTSKSGKKQREQAIKLMQQGEMHYLFASYNLAKEGLDIPRLNRMFLATPKKDKAVVTQSVGRISRTFEGKENAIVYDYVHSNWLCKKMFKERERIYKSL